MSQDDSQSNRSPRSNHDTIASPKSIAVERHPVHYLSDDGFIFQIENSLYRIPSRVLNESEFFRDMFEVASPHVGSEVEGLTDERPITPAGVTKFQMNSLLTVLQASLIDEDLSLTTAQWAAVLQLSSKWMFQAAKEYAIGQIDKRNVDLTARIILARECGVSNWLKPAFVNLCARPQSLTSQEASKIGLTTSIGIARVRENMALRSIPAARSTPFVYCSRCQRTCFCQPSSSYNYPDRCDTCLRYCRCGRSDWGIHNTARNVFAAFPRSDLEKMVDEMAELQM